MDVIRHSVCTEAARRMLPRGPGLSPIGMNMIGLNADQLVSTGFNYYLHMYAISTNIHRLNNYILSQYNDPQLVQCKYTDAYKRVVMCQCWYLLQQNT